MGRMQDKAPTMRCIDCREEFQPTVTEEYRGEFPSGGYELVLDMAWNECPECMEEAFVVDGEENGWHFDTTWEERNEELMEAYGEDIKQTHDEAVREHERDHAADTLANHDARKGGC